jgi:adenylate cyclase
LGHGNIGAPSRLDFTVIGPAVNLVSRIEGLCKVIGRTLLASDEFAQLVPGRLASLGWRPVTGLDAPVEVFGAPVGLSLSPIFSSSRHGVGCK